MSSYIIPIGMDINQVRDLIEQVQKDFNKSAGVAERSAPYKKLIKVNLGEKIPINAVFMGMANSQQDCALYEVEYAP